MLVTYDDTPCFALGILERGDVIRPDSFVTLVVTEGGDLTVDGEVLSVKRGEKLFVPFGVSEIISVTAKTIVCYPPKRS